jgi:hypothetical protein
MAIILFLGNIGSGKTVSAVKEMVDNVDNRKFYTDIIPTKQRLTPQIVQLNPDMMVIKQLKRTLKHRDGKTEDVYDYKLNDQFWLDRRNEKKSIVIDECHKYMDARRSYSKVNKLFNDFLALARRIVEDSQGGGNMIFITQLGRRADVILREMAHEVKYHKCWYHKTCKSCGAHWQEHSDMPDGARFHVCPACHGYDLVKHGHVIEVFCFDSIKTFQLWDEFGKNTQMFYKRYFISDITNYFKYYDTHQWSNMFGTLY